MRQGVSDGSTSHANHSVSGIQPVQQRDQIAQKKSIGNETTFVAFLFQTSAGFELKKQLRFPPLLLLSLNDFLAINGIEA
jgi:hypothetical protein